MSIRLLAHDVGKYVARTARNLPAEGDVPRVLVDMLCRDLYALTKTQRASERFEELAENVDADLSACRSRFEEIDALEAEVRAGAPEAVRRAARLAMEIEARLRELLG